MTPDNTQRASARDLKSVPAGTFTISYNGINCDLSDLIGNGAKFTVLFDKYQASFKVTAAAGDKHYFRLYHALKRWERLGLLTYYHSVIDTRSPELTQKKGVFVRATQAARYKTPNLINDLQNSKKFAQEPAHPEDTGKWLSKIPSRCGWLRMHAVRRLISINNYNWFIRDPKTKILSPELTKKLSQVNKIFDEWDTETAKKIIILRNLRNNTYIEKPYRTRFNDEGRKLKNVKIYNTGIENSLKKYKVGIFLTLTTDPKLWLSPKGFEFTRYIKDDTTGKNYQFEAVGKGGDLYEANRHESTAWREWYEAETHRRRRRIPYIRCVEFQKNGLIHTHVLLFDVEWDRKWYDFAKEWGTKYGQGFMNKAYEIRNDGDKWIWKKNSPTDTDGKAPADYLKKYLIKSMYESSGFALYWATNKRFFTMSETLRYYSYDEKIAEDDWKKEHKPVDPFDYVGACQPPEAKHIINMYLKQKEGTIPETSTNHLQKKRERLDLFPTPPPPQIPDIENPDEIDEPDYYGLSAEEIEWEQLKATKEKKKHEYDILFF